MEIFLVTAPGLEGFLAEEAAEAGFEVTETISGGVTIAGDWPEVWRANRELRGATRVLARLAGFRAMHLAQLDKRTRKLPWVDWLRPDVPFRVEAVCRASRIYHKKAAAERVTRAIAETLGAPAKADADLVIKVRIDDDLCTLSVDTSGPSLHLRGLKTKMHKAPMRETLASLFLRACRFDGVEPVYDPMCGGGTFPIEAAEIAMGLVPGRARSFAFEQMAATAPAFAPPAAREVDGVRFFGSDRDAGAIAMARTNAESSGVASATQFETKPVSDITAPQGAPGLVIINPPYGGRVGNKKPLYGLYASLGARLRQEFTGWRVGMITTEPAFAKAAGLEWDPPGPVVNHGGIRIRLWQAKLN